MTQRVLSPVVLRQGVGGSRLRISRTVALLAVLALSFVGACGDAGRPTEGTWRTAWTEVRAEIPAVADFVDGADKDRCADGLSIIRTRQEDLVPTFDEDLDSVVEDWVATARAIFFECPPTADDGFTPGYDRLTKLGEQVEAALSAQPEG